MDGRMEKGGMGSVGRTGARMAPRARASQQLRIHLLHDFEMADGLQDGNVMPRRRSRSKLRLSPFDCNAVGDTKHIAGPTYQTQCIRCGMYVISMTLCKRCFAPLTPLLRRDSSKRREKVPKWSWVFAPGRSAVRVQSVQNLSTRNFRLNNAMAASFVGFKSRLESFARAFKSESVCDGLFTTLWEGSEAERMKLRSLSGI